MQTRGDACTSSPELLPDLCLALTYSTEYLGEKAEQRHNGAVGNLSVQ